MQGRFTPTAQRMRKVVIESLVTLLEKKDFENLTVQDILTVANINRSTFYKYFQDKYDLAKNAVEYFTDKYLSIFAENKNKPFDYIFGLLYDYLLENKRLFNALLKINTRDFNSFQLIIEKSLMIRTQLGYETNFCSHIEDYYIADIHYIPLYYLMKSSPPPAKPDFIKMINSAVLGTLAKIFNIPESTVSTFIEKNKNSYAFLPADK